jgi:hypothetical protein
MLNYLEHEDDLEQAGCSGVSLLDSWLVEQSERFEKLHRQLKLIARLPAANLDDLADKLEDIDYHVSALSNILDLVVSSNYYDDDNRDAENTPNIEFDNPENSRIKRWPLVEALWFHMMMLADPESIYYSSRIGKSAWPNEFTSIE